MKADTAESRLRRKMTQMKKKCQERRSEAGRLATVILEPVFPLGSRYGNR